MTNLDLLIEALDSAHWELSEAFKGLPDEDVWKRPHPRLLSIGEIASHIAHWEDFNITGGTTEGPFTRQFARYYPVSIENPLVMDIGAEALFKEIERIHQIVKKHLLENPPNLEAKSAFREDWTWGYCLQYMAFHVAYHTGQIYSVRHLMGHETVDN